MIPLARHFGLDTGYASTVLGVATWVGIAGCRAVVVFGTRFGRAWPLAIGAVLTVARNARIPLERHRRAVYLLANCVTGITWSFAISYLLGMCAEFDQTGRTAALGGLPVEDGARLGAVRGCLAARGRRLRALVNVSAIVLA